MPIRPGRMFPSVIIGALVAGGLALSTGTAVGAPVDPSDLSSNECLDPLTDLPLPVVAGVLEKGVDGLCEAVEKVTDPNGSGDGDVPGSDSGPNAGGGSGDEPSSGTPGTGTPTGSPTDPTDPAAPPGSGGDPGEAGDRPGGVPAAQSGSGVVQAPPALPAPDVRAVNALATSSFSAPGGLAAGVPTLGIGTLDPSLLLAPAGSPLRTLTGVDQGSPVTTTSDVQAMAFDNLPGGFGTPAVTGVLILSTFAAFALRHRVLRRPRPAGNAEPHADTHADNEADTDELPARRFVG